MSDEVCPICGWRESAGHAEICPRNPQSVAVPTHIPNILETFAAQAKRDLRQRAAIVAMQGLCAALDYCKGYLLDGDEIASDAVYLADHLIAELEKKYGES